MQTIKLTRENITSF